MFTLPTLWYEYNALEPYIDDTTMETHHSKHHAWYTKKLNNAIAGTQLEWKTIEYILKHTDLAWDAQQSVINNWWWYYNHMLFWENLCPSDQSTFEETSELWHSIAKTFCSFDEFKQQFVDRATSQFWSWRCRLIKDSSNTLSIVTTSNQNNPIMNKDVTVLLWIDVREHAYYLKYKNKRAEYLQNIRHVIDRATIQQRYMW